MKNKKLLYFLLPAAVVLWGIIIYKVFISVGTESEAAVDFSQGNRQSFVTTDTIFKLKADYPDPFLKRYMPGSTSKPVEPAGEKKTVTAQPVAAKPVNWPEISFGGKIENNDSRSEIYLISVNRRNYLVNVNGQVSDIKLVKASEDSVVVQMLGQSKTIYRSN